MPRGRISNKTKIEQNHEKIPVQSPEAISSETPETKSSPIEDTIPEIAKQLLYHYNLSYQTSSPKDVRQVFNIHNEIFPEHREAKIHCSGCVFRVYERVRGYLRTYNLIK